MSVKGSFWIFLAPKELKKVVSLNKWCLECYNLPNCNASISTLMDRKQSNGTTSMSPLDEIHILHTNHYKKTTRNDFTPKKNCLKCKLSYRRFATKQFCIICSSWSALSSRHLIVYLTYFHNATNEPFSPHVHNVMQAQKIDHLFHCFQNLFAIVAKT